MEKQVLIRIKERVWGELRMRLGGRVCGAKVGETDVWEATFLLIARPLSVRSSGGN